MKAIRCCLRAALACLPTLAASAQEIRLNRLRPSPRVRGLAELEWRARRGATEHFDAVMLIPSVRQGVSFGGIRTPAGAQPKVEICPVGFKIACTGDALDLFEGLKRPEKGADPRPGFLAYAAGGKTAVRELADGATASLDGMSEPWVLFWGGILPTILVVQQPVKAAERAADRVRLTFAGNAGTSFLVMPFGQFYRHPTDAGGMGVPEKAFRPGLFSASLGTRPESEWKDGLPEAVIAYVRGWARRLRRMPVEVSESCQLVDGGVKFTESFIYEDIEDSWQTPRAAWAVLPPIVALARAVRGPVAVEGEAVEQPWLCPFGPLAVADGKESISFTVRIPELGAYLWSKPAPVPGAAAKHPRFAVLRDKLRAEIDKILAVNEHMAPFRNLGTGGGSNWHWGNPGETIISLAWALPFLEPGKAEALKAYIRKEFQAYDPLATSFAPLGVGARREFYEPFGERHGFRPGERERNPLNLYAVWEYVDKVAGAQAAAELWPRAKKFFEDELKDYQWDAGESPRVATWRGVRHSSLNARLAGYIGTARLARLAGDKEAEALATCLLARGLAVLHAQAFWHQFLIERGLAEPLPNLPPGFLGTARKEHQAHLLPLFDAKGLWFNSGMYSTAWPYVFLMDLTPEVGAFLHAHARDPVSATLNWMMWRCPGLWLNRGLRPFASAQGENWVIEPYVPWVNFLGLALVARPPAEELAWHVGDSRARFGDLYYIQRLALALRALAGQ